MKFLFIAILILSSNQILFSQALRDNFEGNSTIATWVGDNCIIDNSFNNPFQTGINTSAKVLRYADAGGQYANLQFNAPYSFNLLTSSEFSLKIYVPSNSITGNQTNQISLKLQNASIAAPWSTQSEIIKPILLNQWQTVTFNFATDAFINASTTSQNPLNRWDFSRVVLQINGENNNDNVVGFIDDFLYAGANSTFKNLVWNDEFDVDGAVSNTNWFHQTLIPNGVGWYNNELQHYTNSTINSFNASGLLNIVAKKEVYTSQLQTKQYTSARLNSKFAFKYGRVEVKAKLPIGAGTWPAIWMLGKSITENGAYWASTFGTKNWPACGEIDIMEHWGRNQNEISSAVHFPVNGNLNAGQYVTNSQIKTSVSTAFHIYAVDWNAQRITFSVDGINHFTYNPSVKNQFTWPFDAEQYILLNVAMEPSVTQSFVQSAMEIDYVRVFQESVPLPLNFINYSATINNNKFVDNKWTTSNEVNVAYFNIQRSTNGKDFSTIGRTAANNKPLNNYIFTDDQLSLNSNQFTYFYQIQTVDKDGKVLHSSIQKINLKPQSQTVEIYPNPVKDYLNIVSKEFIKDIKIINQQSQVIKHHILNTKFITINTKQLLKGMYVVQTTTISGQINNQKIVVQ